MGATNPLGPNEKVNVKVLLAVGAFYKNDVPGGAGVTKKLETEEQGAALMRFILATEQGFDEQPDPSEEAKYLLGQLDELCQEGPPNWDLSGRTRIFCQRVDFEKRVYPCDEFNGIVMAFEEGRQP